MGSDELKRRVLGTSTRNTGIFIREVASANYDSISHFVNTTSRPSRSTTSQKTDLSLAVNYSPVDQLKDEFIRYRSEYIKKRLSALKVMNGEGGYEQMLDEIAKDVEHTKASLSVFKSFIDKK